MTTITSRLIKRSRAYLHGVLTGLLLCLTMLFPLFLSQANSQPHSPNNILVIYPESNPAYQRLYNKIVKGMQDNNRASVITQTFNKSTTNDEIEQQITKTNARAVIALGKHGKLFAQQLELDIPIITGAHVLAEEGKASVSLAADPFILFTRLKHLKPEIKTIYVIHNKQNTHWLIKDALVTAKELKLNLKVFVAEDLKQTSSLLKDVIEQAQKNNSAVWLPLDPVLPINILLPELLRAAWDKNIVVFSNNPVDVQKGVLFAMYPDYRKMGTQLVDLAIARINGLKNAAPEPSRYLNSAVNSRTATHLGVKADLNTSDFNLFFPERL